MNLLMCCSLLAYLSILVEAQQALVKLNQGNLLGLKVYPDGSHTAVNAFLGVPYAQAPIHELRFAAPKAHNGWNTTLNAVNFKPVCPQLTNTIYDEMADGLDNSRVSSQDSEDCLYLNIWVSETGMGYGNLPVLVVITGEDMSYDWPRNRITGLDLAIESILVITVQYRSNIFGWINLQSNEIPGNFGIQDLEMALQWIRHNVQRFGGNPQQITLLGHGTTGAPLAMSLTLLTQYRNDDNLISKLILMSGGDIPYALGVGHQMRVAKTSRLIIQKLGCHFEERHNQIIACLRSKSVTDLLRAYEAIYKNGNGTLNLGMTLPQSLDEILKNDQEGERMRISLPPTMIGIGTNEGAFLQDYWLDLAREGYQQLKDFISNTVLPNILRRFLDANQTQATLDSIWWRYFGDEHIGGDVTLLLMGLGRLISESSYEAPFYNLLKQFTNRNITTFAYVFRNTNPMYDLRGKMNYFGGASHTSELPLLFGPSLFKAISRRRFTGNEERQSKKLRRILVSFIRSSNPTRGRIYDSWLSFTQGNSFIYNIGDDLKTTVDGVDDMLQSNEAEIQKLLMGEKQRTNLYQGQGNNYQSNYMTMSGNVADLRQSKSSASYFSNQQDSGYAIHLRRVYGFWKVFLTTNVRYNDSMNSYTLSQRLQLMEASAEAARYRHGFFALLSLVCLLLICLCLCVYLLRRNPLSLMASSTSDREARYCL